MHGRAGADTAPPLAKRLGWPSTLAYGFGSIAYGIKDNGFQTFLLIYYNQVIGLPAVSVGVVIMLALVLDAVVDPAIGALSDRTRSRLGRRHPWMYAAALPIALGWLLLWNPPRGWSHPALLAWVFATAVLTRTAVSAYEVPSQALAPELSSDYDERTRITAYRYLFGWIGGLAMLVAAYSIFLVPSASAPVGLLNRVGYEHYAIAGAIVIFLVIIISATGTYREVARLPHAGGERIGVRETLHQMWEASRDRAFLILMGAGLCVYSAQGITFALSNYLYALVWRFTPAMFASLAVIVLVGVSVAFLLATPVARRLGKRRAAASFSMLGSAIVTIPYLLRFADMFPEPGAPLMLPLLYFSMVVSAACAVASMILGSSMMADVVEHSEAATGRRSEGFFAAGSFFVQKTTGGIGIFVAGAVLSFAGIDHGTTLHPPAAAIDRLTGSFCLASLVLGAAAALFYWRFPFDKAEHDARVSRLMEG